MGFKFLKTGKESVALAAQDKIEAQIRKEESAKAFRFYLKVGEDARITFVDGEIPKGYLEPPRYYEHLVFFNGVWTPFVCPEKTNPDSGEDCPIDDLPDRPSLVSAFTVIDHREYTSKKDSTKKYKNTKKLFICKGTSFEMLNKIAIKIGGLAGQTFDVSRTGDKEPGVGNMFLPIEKKTIEELKAIYQEVLEDPKTNTKTKQTYFIPYDYEKEITYRTGDELRKLGFGKPGAQTVASPAGNTGGEHVDYSQQL